VIVRGHTDLAIGDHKFAGNSQRRRRQWLLFHGTLLLSGNLDLISELLRMPTLEPDYRSHRSHNDFVRNIHVTAETIKMALRTEWNASELATDAPLGTIAAMARDKYSTSEWNHKF
jgi:lipoate-protein ligase A